MQVVRSPRYSEAFKVRVLASPKKKKQALQKQALQIFSNNQITLLVLRKHPRKLLMILLLYNLANGKVLRACQKKKTSNSPRPVTQKTSNSPSPVRHQKRSRKVVQTSTKGRGTLQKVSFRVS